MADDISDSFAASLLKKEAAERSLKYSAFGLVAFGGDRKKPNSAPKPNTRFLKTLVKEADSHNTALLAKEAEDARLRLEKFKKDERRRKDGNKEGDRDRLRSRSRSPDRSRRRRSRSRSKDRRPKDRDDYGRERKRQKVGITDIDRLLQASRREKRDGGRDADKTIDTRRDRDRDQERSRRKRSRSRERDRHRDKDRSTRNRSRSRSLDRRKHRSRRSRSRSDSHSRSASSSRERTRRNRKYKSRRRTRSPTLSRSRSPHRRKRSRSPVTTGHLSLLEELEDDDPLAPYLKGASKSSREIGPSLPKSGSKPRGRGGQGSSAMDARFDPSYDPTLDVAPEKPEDEDDWEAALEALRDRQKWKQQGAERLKSAGFDDDFIEAWATNTTKDEKRIKWNKDKGGRDWDRGKVIDEDTGEVQLKATWA